MTVYQSIEPYRGCRQTERCGKSSLSPLNTLSPRFDNTNIASRIVPRALCFGYSIRFAETRIPELDAYDNAADFQRERPATLDKV